MNLFAVIASSSRKSVAIAVATFLIAAQAHAQAARPNVLFILTDDQGSIDVNCYGAKDLVTPNMDSIAAKGTRFTQFEAAAPICSPSRAAILTGKVPQKAGLPGMASSEPGGHGMPGGQFNMANMFKSAGYATAHFGKWHLGYVKEESPNANGFDYSFGHMGGCIDSYSHYFYWAGPNRHDLWRNGKEVWYDGQFFGDLTTSECNSFIDQHKTEPFFIYWAINYPHYPLQGKAKWRDYYANLPSPRNMYAASVSTADDMIGEVLAHLDQLGLRQNTIVVFMSDQGYSCEARTFGGGGNGGPYRGAKYSLFEGGTRVPAMISWPGHVPENAVRDQLATGCDWLPTLAELCGVTIPADAVKIMDGASLLPIIKSESAPSPHPTFYWASGSNQWSVRDGDWKLLGNPIDPAHPRSVTKSDGFFLANLKDDVSEQKNIAADHPDIVERLKKMHEEWFKSVGGKGGGNFIQD